MACFALHNRQRKRIQEFLAADPMVTIMCKETIEAQLRTVANVAR